MRAVGIICEYNPFHAGHAHLLERVRAAGAETVICLMSGNFVQRGEAAVLPPVARAEMALAAGADLVLKLPFPYAAASARYFATAGVRALARLGCDTLAFGSESADRAALLACAQQLNTPEVLDRVKAAAPETGDAAALFAALPSPPASNDILALEYTRAILDETLPMEIYPVLRVGSAYRAEELGGEFPSATALRAMLARGEEITAILPPVVRDIWDRARRERGIADISRLGGAMLSLLRSGRDLSGFADCGGGLSAHLARAAAEATDYASLCRAAATKRYTDGRIRRALLALLAGVTREDVAAPVAYLRLLGANEVGREFLSKTRKTRTVPVVTKQADIAALGEGAARARALAAVSDGLYALCLGGDTLPAELSTAPPVMR